MVNLPRHRFFEPILIALAVLLGACQPIHRTYYTLTPPASTEGRICVNQCEQIRQTCHANCGIADQSCRQEAQLAAQSDFDAYVRDRESKGREVEKELDDFYDTYRCREDDCQAACDARHRACYTGCGGRVAAYTRCVSFCD